MERDTHARTFCSALTWPAPASLVEPFLQRRCSWSGYNWACTPDPTCLLRRPPVRGTSEQSAAPQDPITTQSMTLQVTANHNSRITLHVTITTQKFITLKAFLTLMLDLRSFFRTSLLMSFTATDSSCWYRWISWLMVPSLAPSFLEENVCERESVCECAHMCKCACLCVCARV